MFAGKGPTSQAGLETEALSVADSVKRVVQHSGKPGTPGSPQALQPPGCIIISDSEEEPDISGHAAADAPPSRSSPPPSLNGPTGNVVGHTCKLAVRTTARKSSSCESYVPPASKRHEPLQRQSEAIDRDFPSNARSPAKAHKQLYPTSSMLDDVKREADVEGDMMQQDKEAGPAFELPSQMPRELQSWAWDKRVGQHPPNLQKLYPEHAKRVRKAPQRYTGVRTPAPLQERHPEEHCRPAQTQSYSGEKRKERQGDLAAAETAMQVQGNTECNMQDAQESPEASDRVNANANLQSYRQEGAAENEAVAMHANNSFLQKHDSRPQACPAQSRNCEASPSSTKSQEAEVLQLKLDNQLLQDRIQAQQRQIAVLQQSTINSHQQATSSQKNPCTKIEVLGFLEGASAQQLIEVIQKVLQLLRTYQPAELDDISSPRDPKAERVEQLLRSLRPQLQGTNAKKWVGALRCLTEALQDLSVAPSDVQKAVEDVNVLKQSCLSGHQPLFQHLVTQLEELCKGWHGWLISRTSCIAKYERRAAELQQLQDRVAVCALAQRVTRQR